MQVRLDQNVIFHLSILHCFEFQIAIVESITRCNAAIFRAKNAARESSPLITICVDDDDKDIFFFFFFKKKKKKNNQIVGFQKR